MVSARGAVLLAVLAASLVPGEARSVPPGSWSAEGDQAFALFGHQVAAAGDVNGDGFDDLLVSASAYDNGESAEGRAFIYLGSAGGPARTPSWTAEGEQAGANFGWALSSAGDVNDDGFDDVIVSANGHDNGEMNEGRAYLYLGSAAGLAATPAWQAEANLASALFGTSVASAGDVNGDGFDDVIVGARSYANGQVDEGRAFVYLGSSVGLAADPAWTAEIDQAGAWFGFSVASAGDVNGDGFDDVIVGAYRYDNVEANEGAAFLYLGSPAGPGATPAWSVEGQQSAAYLGVSVGTAGDVNGDGFDDVVVGSQFQENGQSNEGRAAVYLGAPAGLATTPAWIVEGEQNGAQLGVSVATAGDVNGDGFDDVVVGANRYDSGHTDEGGAFLYLGSATGLSLTAAWHAEGNQAGAQLGLPVAGAGDVNGDGLADLVIGAQLYDGGATDEGGVFVEFCPDSDGDGYGSPGRPVFCRGASMTDCNDSDPAVSPGAAEICDGLDNDCDTVTDDVAAPVGAPELRAEAQGADALLAWTAVAFATAYDVVRGGLGTLASSGGDFTTAVDACEADDETATSILVTGDAAPGDGSFYLVRPVNCGGPGSYDSEGPAQVGSRDVEIDASTASCP